MTKQIEDYPELDKWCDDNFIHESDSTPFECYEAEAVEQKLLEMQSRIDELEKYNIDLANESHSKSVKIDSLTEQLDQAIKDAYMAESKAYNDTEDTIVRLEDEVNSLAEQNKEAAVKAINDVADEMDKIYLHDYERKSVKGEQWYWWCRVYKFMKDKAKQLQEQE